MKESLRRLLEIVEELENLENEAREILAEHYPDTLAKVEGSKAINFGSSHNGGAHFILCIHQIEE